MGENKKAVKIKLKHPFELDGRMITELTLRLPMLADELAAAKLPGTDAEREAALLARLCDLNPEDYVSHVSAPDHRALAEAYNDFFA